ncbi:MAG: thioesterase family protein [Hyphomonas sp.]|nr:thioesterase family protein [Hyphomonas sp.]
MFPSRIPSFIDISLINFFIGTRMSAVVRRNGWIPIVVSSVQTRRQPEIPGGELEIHTRVVGWEDQYVEIEHTWFDANGAEVLNSVYLTRVTHAGRDKVTGADMLRELGEAYVEAPLSPTARGLLEEYLRVKDANQALSLA